MILEAILGFMLEVFGELIGESLMELSCSFLARLVPLRLRYGHAWRWRARQVVTDRRIATGSYLKNG
jgi:hypothetical protein